MASLLDLAGASAPAVVSVDGVDVAVTGITVRGIAILMGRFESIRAILSGRDVELSPQMLFDLGPDVVAAVIAAGTGAIERDGAAYRINADAEAVAGTLGLEAQVDLVEAILNKTFPRGPKGFFEKLARMASVAGVMSEAKPA